MKINKLEIENVKRVRALTLEPSANGLTVIGGRNGQGKTSVLDAIAWALGGEKYRPGSPVREGSVIPPSLKVELSNGIIVERKGKNSALTVTDPKGEKAGQTLLDAFVEKLALDLPRFMQANNKEKADTLLKIIGVEDQLKELRSQENATYNRRHALGQIADQKMKFAKEMAHYPDVPLEPVSVSELIKQQQEILTRNGENQRKRAQAVQLQETFERQQAEIQELSAKLDALSREHVQTGKDLQIAKKTADALQDESTAELEASIKNAETINNHVRANLEKVRAEKEAQEYKDTYDALSDALEQIRDDIRALLAGANLPLPELSVNEAGELTYKGFGWGDMSSSEQLKVATAIVRKLNPDCGFVLIDKLEMMDLDTLKDFGSWLEAEGLQAIATRVSTGGECQVIIEDGMAQGAEPAKTWKEGQF